MNKQELSELFTDSLKTKLLGTFYRDRKICDLKVEILQEDWEDEGGGGSYDTIHIKVKTQSPKGKNSIWVNYWIY